MNSYLRNVTMKLRYVRAFKDNGLMISKTLSLPLGSSVAPTGSAQKTRLICQNHNIRYDNKGNSVTSSEEKNYKKKIKTKGVLLKIPKEM